MINSRNLIYTNILDLTPDYSEDNDWRLFILKELKWRKMIVTKLWHLLVD